jgi:hypothetical protein
MGAASALKGYRTQFLYSLYRILIDLDKDYVFRIEGGYEDIDILDSQREYVESIQVKNKNGNLNFSDLFTASDSFFKRASKLLTKNNQAKFRLVSFGNVSDELKNNQTLAKKLRKKKFKDETIDGLLKAYQQPELVNEEDLTSQILQRLKSFNIFTNPNIALELLLFWIYLSGENKTDIVGKDFLKNLNRIGQFISEQDSFHNQFGKSISPITSKNLFEENVQTLEKTFYYGISAKYEHILADLDVVREGQLNLIKAAFSKSNIVFVHGASGQGKSTLAYRYIHDYLESNAVYELRLSTSANEVFQTLNTLEAMCKGLNFPITIYVDVEPHNNNWNSILKELSSKKNLNFLITIRQEDWNRIILGDDYEFQDIELVFNRDEAKVIYDSLSSYRTDLKFTDFEDSWLEFGMGKMLLEYVYLISEGDKLKIRLQNQVLRLEQEKKVDELKILKYVCIADTFNSKLDYLELLHFLEIDSILSNSYVQALEKEYLLKYSSNKKFLTGLHPIRSRLLYEILIENNDFEDKNQYISNSLNLIDEEDLNKFLLNSYMNGYEVQESIQSLNKITFKSWAGFLNSFNSLLWKGACDYALITNKEVFEDAYALLKGSWWIFVFVDFTDMMTSKSQLDLLDILHKNDEGPNKRGSQIENLTTRLTHKNEVFKYCNSWLENYSQINLTPTTSNDYKNLGEFLFWLGHLKSETSIKLKENDLLRFFKNENEDIEIKSLLLLGLKSNNYFIVKEEFKTKVETIFLTNFRNLFNIPYFADNGKELSSKFFFDLTSDYNNKKSNNNHVSASKMVDSNIDLKSLYDSSNIFHESTMRILNILRQAFSDREKFQISGVGYNPAGMVSEYDPTLKNIAIENLPLPFLTGLNRLIINIVNYQYRAENWEKYIAKIIDDRRIHYEALLEFRKGIIMYFKNDTKGLKFLIENESLIKQMLSEVENQKLPKSIADKWFYLGDDIKEKDDYKNIRVAYSAFKYRNFTSVKRDYFANISNYINRSYDEISNTLKRLNGRSDEIENENLRDLTEVILSDSFKNQIAFQDELVKKFEKYYEPKELLSLSEKEKSLLLTHITVWKAFLYSPHRYQPSILKSARLRFEKTILDLRLRILKETRDHFSGTDLYGGLITDTDNKNLIFLLNVTVENSMDAVWSFVDLILRIFGSTHHTSLKNLILSLNFETVTLVQLIDGKPIHDKFFEVSTSKLNYIQSKLNEGYEFTSLFEIFNIPEDTNKEFLRENDIVFWNDIIPGIKLYEECYQTIVTLQYFDSHLEEIKLSFENVDIMGNDIVRNYFNKIQKGVLTDVAQEIELRIDKLSNLLIEKADAKLDVESKSDFEELREISNEIEILIGKDMDQFSLSKVLSKIPKIEESYMNFVQNKIDEFQDLLP